MLIMQVDIEKSTSKRTAAPKSCPEPKTTKKKTKNVVRAKNAKVRFLRIFISLCNWIKMKWDLSIKENY